MATHKISQKICSVEDCPNSVWARGWCDKHYRRWKAHDDPLFLDFEPWDSIWDEGFAEYFWNKAVKGDDGCWRWRGIDKKGRYGKILVGETKYQTHRLSWILTHNVEPTLLILHHCDHPSCINPEHLYEGTDADNSRDKVMRDRMNPLKGEQHPKSKLTDAKVRDIKQELKQGIPWNVLSEKYGVVKGSIGHIAAGRSWKHVL